MSNIEPKINQILDGFRQEHIQFEEAAKLLESYYCTLPSEVRRDFFKTLWLHFLQEPISHTNGKRSVHALVVRAWSSFGPTDDLSRIIFSREWKDETQTISWVIVVGSELLHALWQYRDRFSKTALDRIKTECAPFLHPQYGQLFGFQLPPQFAEFVQRLSKTVDRINFERDTVDLRPQPGTADRRPGDRKIGETARSKSQESLPMAVEAPLVLISHSGKDVQIARALINLLRSGLGLLATQIRCSSVDGYRLPAGVNTDDQLRSEIMAAKVLVGLLTPNSMASTYVLFELGARWGAHLFMIPLLAAVKPEDMRGPHRVLNALSCETESQLIQLIDDIGRELGITPQSAAAYLSQAQEINILARELTANEDVTKALAPRSSMQVAVRTEGEAPRQVLKITAPSPIILSRIEYLLSDETCITGDDLSFEGTVIEVPLSQESLIKVLNTPRPDRITWDNSGPFKLAITLSFKGSTRQVVVPARLENPGPHRSVVGSKVFYL